MLELRAELIEKRWLVRIVDLKTDNKTYRVTYFGRGEGYECVFLDERLVSKTHSFWWYSPRLEFDLAGAPASVNGRLYPWLMIKRFWIEVDGKIVYSEG